MGSLGSQEGNQEGTDGGMSPPETVATKKAREELDGLALESRTAYLSIALLPDSVLAIRETLSRLQRTSEPAVEIRGTVWFSCMPSVLHGTKSA